MKFIVFEGLDGSGKSSLMQRLEQELVRRCRPLVRTREPGGTPLGKDIRHLILRKEGSAPTPRTELLLYEASRAQHVDCIIAPALREGKWVLCDRFSASSVAFQAGGRAISIPEVEWLNRFATENRTPDLTILLDLSVEGSRQRRQIRALALGETEDRIESEKDDFHGRVRQSFLEQAQQSPQGWLVLDASLSVDDLEQVLLKELEQRGFWES